MGKAVDVNTSLVPAKSLSVSAYKNVTPQTLASLVAEYKTRLDEVDAAGDNFFDYGEIYFDKVNETSAWLTKVKSVLEPLDWTEFKDTCKTSEFYKRRKAARSPRIAELARRGLLPRGWTLHYQRAMMSERVYREGLANGKISRASTLDEIRALRGLKSANKPKKQRNASDGIGRAAQAGAGTGKGTESTDPATPTVTVTPPPKEPAEEPGPTLTIRVDGVVDRETVEKAKAPFTHAAPPVARFTHAAAAKEQPVSASLVLPDPLESDDAKEQPGSSLRAFADTLEAHEAAAAEEPFAVDEELENELPELVIQLFAKWEARYHLLTEKVINRVEEVLSTEFPGVTCPKLTRVELPDAETMPEPKAETKPVSSARTTTKTKKLEQPSGTPVCSISPVLFVGAGLSLPVPTPAHQSTPA